MTRASPARLCVGTFVGAHGVRGEARLKSLTDAPESLFAYGPLTDESGARVFALRRKGVVRGNFIVAVDGVTTRAEAEALRGQSLYADRANLPPVDETAYYVADLIGLEARDATGQIVGRVADAHDYGAGLFLEIKPAAAASFMLPFREPFVPEVNLEKGYLVVDIPEGWV